MNIIMTGGAAIALRELLLRSRGPVETDASAGDSENPDRDDNVGPGSGGEVVTCGVAMITDANGNERWFRDSGQEVDEPTAFAIMKANGCGPGFGG